MDCTQLRRNAEQYMMRHPEKENVTSLTHWSPNDLLLEDRIQA